MASAVQPKEEYYKNTILDNRLRDYLEKGIKDLTGISFIDYMSMPRETITQIGRVVEEFSRMKLRIQENAEEEARRKEREAEEKRKRESKRIVNVSGNVMD